MTAMAAQSTRRDARPVRDIIGFCLLAYGFSWIWWAPMVIPRLRQLSLSQPLPELASGSSGSALALGMLGPLFAALLMRLFVSGEGVKGSVGIRRPARFYLVAVAAPALFMALLIAINHLTGLGRFVWSSATPLPLAYLAAVLVNGILLTPLAFAEEYGWRGYLLPRLLPLGEMNATILLGLIWAGWHVPAIIIGLNYPGVALWMALAVFFMTAVLMAFPFSWLFLASGRSVLVVAVMHAVLNGVSDTFATPARIPDASPLIAGAGGLVTAGLLFAVVATVYGYEARRARGPPGFPRLPLRRG